MMLEDRAYDDLHQVGVKDDSAKPRLDLVLGDFDYALWEVGLVGTYGANKYTDRGWHEVENGIERYSNALLRHYFNSKKEAIDSESGLPHLAHMAWNALAILQLYMESTRDIVGTIEEVQSDHPDFKPIKQYTPTIFYDKDDCCGSGVYCNYKYDCHYKEIINNSFSSPYT